MEVEEINDSINNGLFYVISIGLLIGLVVFIFRSINSDLWIRGKVPRFVNYSEESMFNIYMSLAALIIKVDRRNTKEKIGYLESYFTKKYGTDKEDVINTFQWAFSNDRIKIKSVCNWLNKNVPDIGYQSQLLYFLAGIAVIDGNINNRERRVLDQLAKGLHIPHQEVEAILASYYEAEYRKRRAKEKERYRNRPTSVKKRQMARILEVSENADFNEIKKAYRKLVKLHHPDRFSKNGPEQIRLAQERFVEIQLAYEYFERYHS